MLDKVSELIGDVQAFKTTSKEEIETFRIKYLGNKGLLKELFAEFKNVDASLKKDLGQALNNLRNAATNKVQELNDSTKPLGKSGTEIVSGVYTEEYLSQFALD